MGFAVKSEEIIYDKRFDGRVILTDSGNRIKFSGQYFWIKCCGFFEDLSVYFFVDYDGEEHVIKWQNCDCGEGWFFLRWKEIEDEKYSSHDAYVYNMIFSKMPERDGQITKAERISFEKETPDNKSFIKMLESLK